MTTARKIYYANAQNISRWSPIGCTRLLEQYTISEQVWTKHSVVLVLWFSRGKSRLSSNLLLLLSDFELHTEGRTCLDYSVSFCTWYWLRPEERTGLDYSASFQVSHLCVKGRRAEYITQRWFHVIQAGIAVQARIAVQAGKNCEKLIAVQVQISPYRLDFFGQKNSRTCTAIRNSRVYNLKQPSHHLCRNVHHTIFHSVRQIYTPH